MSKITKATFKSFLKKNSGKVFLKVTSHFDGQIDCVTSVEDSFSELLKTDRPFENNLGYQGVWLVHSSGNYFRPYQEENMTGIYCSNCCGSFIVAIKN